jgi:hypothetical protein
MAGHHDVQGFGSDARKAGSSEIAGSGGLRLHTSASSGKGHVVSNKTDGSSSKGLLPIHSQSLSGVNSLKSRGSFTSPSLSEAPKVFRHRESSAQGYVAGPWGEWRMLNALHYTDSNNPFGHENCTCWLRVQAAATIESIRSAQNNPFLKVVAVPANASATPCLPFT